MGPQKSIFLVLVCPLIAQCEESSTIQCTCPASSINI